MAKEIVADFSIGEQEKIEGTFEITRSGGGVRDHDKLRHRDLPDQHPISSITDLTETLSAINNSLEDKVSTSTKINNKPLSEDITLTAQDVGALPSDTPIPTVNDSTITISQSGEEKGSFTLNQSTNKTIYLDKGLDFPTFVDGSGTTLPTPENVGQTFLKTDDKKVYTVEDGEFILASDITNEGNINVSTGEFTGFTSQKYLYSTRYSNSVNDIDLHFKTGNDITTSQYILCQNAFISYQMYNLGYVSISNGKLYIGGTEVCNVQTDTEYHITGLIKASGSFQANVTENGVSIASGNYAYSITTNPTGTKYTYFGVRRNSYTYQNPFLGTLYGDTNFIGLLGETEGETSWDDGVSLENKTMYVDKTNSILYLYKAPDLVAIGV